jgi:uncharacterized Zn finger protein
MEKKFLMKVVEVRLHCDECGEPMELESTGMGAYMTYSYVYKCPTCGRTHTTTVKYPKTEFIPTNTPVITK